MTNETMIFNAAIDAGIFTEEEAMSYLSAGMRLPLHTYAQWAALGYQVKRGEHAVLKMRLWKYKNRRQNVQDEDTVDAPESRDDFFLTTANLFHISQVERVQPA